MNKYTNVVLQEQQWYIKGEFKKKKKKKKAERETSKK